MTERGRFPSVFVLSAGRTGSTSFYHAAQAITNYSSGHETNIDKIGSERFRYPTNHIEIDNRLSWFLGSLDRHFGNEAFYVHLLRDRHAVATSFSKRFLDSTNPLGLRQRVKLILSIYKGYDDMPATSPRIIDAFSHSIIMRRGTLTDYERRAVCYQYVDTVTDNIELFLKDKDHKMTFHLENARYDFPEFWERIYASGHLEQALAAFQIKHNASQ